MVSNARKKANLKWDKNHPNETRHRQLKSQTKRFITREASVDELNWVEKLVNEVRKK